jgi:hypothetical protein
MFLVLSVLMAQLVPPASGVICITPLPPADEFGTAGKGASTQEYDDSPEARARRVAQAKNSKPVVFSVGNTASVPVTDRQAACIDGIPLGQRLFLKANGNRLFPFKLTPADPVQWLTFSPFYGNDRLDPLPTRLFCPKRSPTPDCSWCPCRSRKYLPSRRSQAPERASVSPPR